MARLDEIFAVSDREVISVVAGMGGVGKTQLAAKYASENKAKFPGGVCWLNGRTGDLIAQILNKVQTHLTPEQLTEKVKELSEPNKIAVWCWRHWLPNGRVLIVLDDVAEWAQVR